MRSGSSETRSQLHLKGTNFAKINGALNAVKMIIDQSAVILDGDDLINCNFCQIDGRDGNVDGIVSKDSFKMIKHKSKTQMSGLPNALKESTSRRVNFKILLVIKAASKIKQIHQRRVKQRRIEYTIAQIGRAHV